MVVFFITALGRPDFRRKFLKIIKKGASSEFSAGVSEANWVEGVPSKDGLMRTKLYQLIATCFVSFYLLGMEDVEPVDQLERRLFRTELGELSKRRESFDSSFLSLPLKETSSLHEGTFQIATSRPNPVASCCLLNDVITSLFSFSNQTISAGGAVLFEYENIASEPIDISMASLSGMILFNRTGIYEICWHLAGISCSDSLSKWSLGLSLDGEIIPFSVFEYPFPSQKGCHAGVSLIHLITDGQELSLINMSENPVQLISDSCGSERPAVSAMLNIKLVAALD